MFRQVYHSSITTAAVCTDSSHRVTEVPPPPKKKGREERVLKTLPKKSAFDETRFFYAFSTRIPPTGTYPSQMDPFHTSIPYFFKIHFNIPVTFTQTNYYFPCSVPSI